ncbi:MAG: hypothetical protein ABW007_16145 [Chitinophagaceae bacterium]
MKHLTALLFAAAFTSLPFIAAAQKGRKQVKDSLSISCILLNAKDITPKKREDGMEELKLVLSSDTDTTVRAGMDAVISKVQRTQEGKWEVVYYHQDYWFWMSGISKVTVRPNQKVKAGDPIGINEPGEPVELLVYDFETPVDPKKYLTCGK